MSKQTKLTLMMGLLFALFILALDVVVMVLSATGVIASGSTFYLLAVILNLFTIFQVYSAVRALIRFAKDEVAAEIAAEEAARTESAGGEEAEDEDGENT